MQLYGIRFHLSTTPKQNLLTPRLLPPLLTPGVFVRKTRIVSLPFATQCDILLTLPDSYIRIDKPLGEGYA